MAYILGEVREQTTMFPVTLEELIPADHMCRVIEAFVGQVGHGEVGLCAGPSRGDGASGVRSARPAEVVSLWVFTATTIFGTTGGRVSAERGSDVAVGTVAAGLQVDC